MARRARCWRARSALTQEVKVIEAAKVSTHAAFLKMASGQLPFLGSLPRGGLAGGAIGGAAALGREHGGAQAGQQFVQPILTAKHAQGLGQPAHEGEGRKGEVAGREFVPDVGVGAQLAADGEQPALLVGGELVFARQPPTLEARADVGAALFRRCLLYTSPSPRDRTRSRMPSSA